jgi:hypothetical protein
MTKGPEKYIGGHSVKHGTYGYVADHPFRSREHYIARLKKEAEEDEAEVKRKALRKEDKSLHEKQERKRKPKSRRR